MTYNIIKTENYLLVVDDSEIKAGDFYLLIPENIVKLSRSGLPINIREWAKIIAHLPLNGAPVLEGVPLLPPLEDEVRELAQKQWGNVHRSGVLGFIEGYNKAKEKYKYTEEDLMEAMLQISEYYADNLYKDLDGHKKSLDIIKSLQQPKMPVAFECEIFEAKDLKSVFYIDEDWIRLGKPKTTTNPQGQTVLVGKYVY